MRHAAVPVSPSSGRAASRQARRGIVYLARAGYAVKGIVYGTIGVLALITALGFGGGRIVGPRGAIETLRTQPLGQAVLWLVAIGLVGFALWRFIEAVKDPEHRGDDAAGIVRRIGMAVSGVSYAALAMFAVNLLLRGGSAGGGGGETSQQSAAMLLQQPWGVWLVGLLGATFVGVGLFQARRAYTLEFRKHWSIAELSPDQLKWSSYVSRIGIAARALAFGLIGWFFLQAAMQADPTEARGLAGALREFYDEPYGAVWLAAIGFGFICYGLYCGLNARYKRIQP